MPIKKIILPNKEIRWEVTEKLLGNGDKKIRRRFEKRVDAQEFLDSYKERKREAKRNNSSLPIYDVEETTLNSEIENWLLKKGDGFTPGYYRVINPALKKVQKLYGHFPISRFTLNMLFEFRLLMKGEGLSPATQNRYIDLITRIINFSYKQRRINALPFIGYEKVRENKEEMLFWDEDEVQTFLSFANRKYPLGSPKRWIYCAYLFALETGARAREIWGLKLSDIPPTGTKIKIMRQALGPNQYVATKGKDSRFVPFSQNLRSEIENMFSHENDERLPDSPLFLTEMGTAVDHDNFKGRVFKKDLKASGLREIRFHDLRHTALTLMVKKGALLPVIQKIAGHKDIKTTMRYVHVMGKDIEEIGAMMSLAVREDRKLVLEMYK